MSTYYVKKQCTHCKNSKTVATIQDAHEIAEDVVSLFSRDPDYEGFTFIVEKPLKFQHSVADTESEATI